MELIVKGLATDLKNGRKRQAIGNLPNDHRMSDALAKSIAHELDMSETEVIPNNKQTNNHTTLSSSIKKINNSKIVNKTPEVKPKLKVTENTPTAKLTKSVQKFAEVY